MAALFRQHVRLKWHRRKKEFAQSFIWLAQSVKNATTLLRKIAEMILVD